MRNDHDKNRTSHTRVELPMSVRAPSPPVGLLDDGAHLIDTFGRVHDNLRISVTDRCNLRCTYCMPEEVVFRDRSELLSFEEITHVVEVAVSLGVDKIRLTGGEPLMRRELPKLVSMITSIPGISDVGMTTNAILLAPMVGPLRDAGLRRLNISLDTLDPDRFRQLARRDGLESTLEGIDAARAAGFDPIKLNAVAIRGFNDVDVVPLARFAREHGFEMRFIEYMPIGADPWEREKVLPAEDILSMLACAFGPLHPDPQADPRAPAEDYLYDDGGGRVGVIASVTKPFCGTCNRIRLTADGKLRNCLFALDEVDVRSLLRDPTADDSDLIRAIRGNVAGKWEGHSFNSSGFVKPTRTMHAIGG